jgi:hypothetical protein
MARLEGAYEEAGHRLSAMDSRLGRLEAKIDGMILLPLATHAGAH